MDPIKTITRRPVLICGCFFPVPPPLEIPARVYASEGHIVEIVPWNLFDMTDVVDYARHIEKYGQAFTSRAGAPINIVAHSLGGVAALYAVKRLGLGTSVSRLVAFGSPFNGSMVAYAGYLNPLFVNIGNQIAPESPFLKDLLAGPLPPGLRVASVAGFSDRICPPPETVMKDADLYIWPFGHTDFMFSENLHIRIDQLLE